jgi:hypothetical protein
MGAKLLLVGSLLFVTIISPRGCFKDESPRPSENLFANGSFEQGSAPWFALESRGWEGFSVTDRYAKEGRHSAHLALRADVSASGSKVFGLIQEVSPQQFPKRIAGWHRVERWQWGTAQQYLQFVVIVQGDASETRFANYQIRYVLTGVEQPPLEIRNARYIFLGKREPIQGEWVYFARDLHADFAQAWGRVPSGFSRLRILFEARYDAKRAGEGEVIGDVYYDDLSLER